MKKLNLFSAIVAVITMLCGIACQEEETKVIQELSTKEVNLNDSVLSIDGKKMEWKFSMPQRPNTISKGLMYGSDFYNEIESVYKNVYQADYKLFDTITYTHKLRNGQQTTYKIRLMRVERKSEPGKYFYVMIDNLSVKLDSACWAYGQTETIPYEYNAGKYGRLYTWNAANALSKLISMRLPRYDKNNPTVPKSAVKRLVKARLLCIQDVNDIMGQDDIGYMEHSIDDDMPYHEEIDDYFSYYDVFLGGINGPEDGGIDYTRGERSLGGFRNPRSHEYYLNNWYISLNEIGYFWLNERGSNIPYDPFHRTFEVMYNNTYNYVAYINVGHFDQYGFSVRYVFEPEYK